MSCFWTEILVLHASFGCRGVKFAKKLHIKVVHIVIMTNGLKWCVLTLLFELSYCDFFILEAPSSTRFRSGGSDPVFRKDLPGIVNFLSGLNSQHLHHTTSWPGLEKVDVFNPPIVNVLVTVHVPPGIIFTPEKFVVKYGIAGSVTSQSPVNELNIALMNDGIESQGYGLKNVYGDMWGGIDMDKVQKKLEKDGSIASSIPSSIGELPKDTETNKLLAEVQMLRDVITKMSDSGERQSVHIMLSALNGIAEKYGSDSVQVKQGMEIYRHFIQLICDSLASRFPDQVLVEVDAMSELPIVTDYLRRPKRDTSSQSTEKIDTSKINLATPNTGEFAVVFNIVLWLMIAFFLTVLAVSYSMWFMDPGKDNIIYRVTSQRMKSD